MSKRYFWLMPLLLMMICFFPYIGCNQEDDEDDDSDTGCSAEVNCYTGTAGCFEKSDDLDGFLDCVSNLEACLITAESCSWQFEGCGDDCGTSTACWESCAQKLVNCRESCGWDSGCIDSCWALLGQGAINQNCPGGELDCITDYLIEVIDDCFGECWT